MAKWYGKIGYAEMVEITPGEWDEKINERSYYGDLERNRSAFQNSSDRTNKNVNISNQISILADPYAKQNFHAMRYAEFMDAKWSITNVEASYPRLILTLGGVWNG